VVFENDDDDDDDDDDHSLPLTLQAVVPASPGHDAGDQPRAEARGPRCHGSETVRKDGAVSSIIFLLSIDLEDTVL